MVHAIYQQKQLLSSGCKEVTNKQQTLIYDAAVLVFLTLWPADRPERKGIVYNQCTSDQADHYSASSISCNVDSPGVFLQKYFIYLFI